MDGLRDDFAGGEVARVAHLSRGAKHTTHRAADLRADARVTRPVNRISTVSIASPS